MSPDLHPEELLDKAAAGALSAEEHARLQQHLQACAVCRFEQKAKAAFVAAPEVELNVDNVVARALAGMPQGVQRSRAKIPAAWAAAAMFITVMSFAAVGVGVVLSRQNAAPASIRVVAPTVEKQIADPEPTIVAEPAAPRPLPKHLAAAPLPAAAAPAMRQPQAPELFASGNAARSRGDRAEASLRYRELLSRFPSSPESRLTHAILARMLLDSGDASGALLELDTYLHSGDEALREEAMSARAMALSLLGRPRDEAAAWNALLETFPESVHAARARERLLELGAP
jgi:hypothetical protein